MKWNDLDGDGMRDTGEPGLQGWTIFLDANQNGQFDDGETATTTDANGNYSFTGLDAGTYVVAEEPQTGWTQMALSSRFETTGDSHYYSIYVSEPQNISANLNDYDGQGTNRLYARFGSLPTPQAYDYRDGGAAQADQQVLIPSAMPGTWYVLAYAETASGPGDYSITTETKDIAVSGVTPDRHGNAAGAQLTVTGAGFGAGTAIQLLDANGTAYAPTGMSVDSYTQVTAQFNLPAMAVGAYDVRVTNSAGASDELADAFQVVQGGEASFQASIDGDDLVYSNTGDLAMPAPLVFVRVTDTSSGARQSMPVLAAGRTPGLLQPGESARQAIVDPSLAPWAVSGSVRYSVVTWLGTDDTTPADWASSKDALRPDHISPEAWDAIWGSFVAEVGDTWGEYVAMLDENAAYLGRLGETVSAARLLTSFEVWQADGFNPLPYLDYALDAQAETPGLRLTFERLFPLTISGRYSLGELGRGWSHNWDFSLQESNDSGTSTVTVTGPGGARRVFVGNGSGGYDARTGDYGTLTKVGGVFQLQEKDGTVTLFRADGTLDYVQDPNARRITAGYDAGRVASLTHSNGAQLLFAYDAQGRIASVTNPLTPSPTDDLVTAYQYDGDHL
ncbi:MAG: hypothetical protein FJ279_17660, partial [Planctomycetes bacterium]|nr:hypothetical protein [Planctomycetota bacterium]